LRRSDQRHPREAVEPVQRMTNGLGADTAFDAIGGEKTASQVIDAVAPGERAVGMMTKALTMTANFRGERHWRANARLDRITALPL